MSSAIGSVKPSFENLRHTDPPPLLSSRRPSGLIGPRPCGTCAGWRLRESCLQTRLQLTARDARLCGGSAAVSSRTTWNNSGPISSATDARHARRTSPSGDINIPNVSCMAATIRRARGAATDAVGLFVKVQPEIKESFERLVSATGASKWALIEAMITRAEADLVAGRGQWLPTPGSETEPLLSDREVKRLRESA